MEELEGEQPFHILRRQSVTPRIVTLAQPLSFFWLGMMPQKWSKHVYFEGSMRKKGAKEIDYRLLHANDRACDHHIAEIEHRIKSLIIHFEVQRSFQCEITYCRLPANE